MRYLVTGGAGFIGAALAKGLLARGDEVVVFDDLSAGVAKDVPAGSTLIVGDVRDTDALAEACGSVDVVFHHAGVKSVPRSMDDPILVNEVNAARTISARFGSGPEGRTRGHNRL